MGAGSEALPRAERGAFEIVVTMVPLLALWALTLFAICAGRCWLYFLMAAPAAGLLVRLFMIQHDCGHGSFFANGQEAALHGSSHYVLPSVLRWFTANGGVHHVRHLSIRIPYYRLPDVLRDHPSLRAVGRITLLQSLACVRLTPWDGTRGSSYRSARRGR